MEGPLTDIRNSISSLSGFKEEFSCGDDSQAGADSLWRLCSLHPWRFKKTRLNEALRYLIWPRNAPFFEQEAKLENSGGLF